ncbi:MAG: hypothetical protein ACR2NP_02855 [Pirellulaceae bacterium]
MSKVIVDGRDQMPETGTLDSFNLGKEVPHELRGLQIAVVHRPEDRSLPFIAMVANNRGSQASSFVDFDGAQRWLESLPEPPIHPDRTGE